VSSNTSETNNPQKWHTLAFLSTTLVFAMSTWFSASAVIPQLQPYWDLSASQAAWLTIAVQLGFVTGALLSSLLNLSDIISPRHVILGGAVGAATANLLLLSAGSISVGILLRFVTGFFLAGVYPPAFKLMSTWFRLRSGLALGILAGAIVLGNGMPHLVNGLGGLDWKVVIVATSILTIIGGLIAELAIVEGPYPFPQAIFNPREAGRVFANRAVRLASIGYIGHMWELFGMYAWFSLFFTSVLVAWGAPAGSAAAYATFSVFVAGGFGCWFGGLLSDRWGRTKTTTVLMIVSGTYSVLVGILLGSSPALVLFVGLVWGFTVVGDSAQFSTMVSELADQAYVGTALALQLAAGFTITVAIIWLIPFLVDIVGWEWAFAFLLPGPVIGVLAIRRLRALPEAEKLAGGLG
jgi:MFS family permease